MSGHEVLSVAQMYAADAAAVGGGVPSLDLMENAASGIVRVIRRRFAPCRALVLAGPGNNGGDGFAVARQLAGFGWPVRVALLGKPEALKGDAAANAARWSEPLLPLAPDSLAGHDLVVDALFGAGLTRPLDGAARTLALAVNRRRAAGDLAVLAVDIPSGVEGDSGQILGAAIEADVTVTFFRKKPGHLLLPGRWLCGETHVADIGISAKILEAIGPDTFVNAPVLWREHVPIPGLFDHKYGRGHAVIRGGGLMTGAARLAARGARRVGAGLVSLAVPSAAFAVYAADRPGTLVVLADDSRSFAAVLDDKRKNALLLGPGAGTGGAVRTEVLAALKTRRAVVLDADALTGFADKPGDLFRAIKGPCVLTPHEGEFSRLFPDLDGDKLTRARAAAKRAGAVVVLKGADTVIAEPDGRAAINAHAPGDLATAGSGDVLAGLILGLLAQGMTPFDAAAAGAWLHGAAARLKGPGLIAEDLPEAVAAVVARLRGAHD